MVDQNLLYTKDHEWVKIEGTTASVGITDYAQGVLGELVFVELPAVGKNFNVHDALAVVESSKSASDVYCPIAGEVTEVNSDLTAKPELVNDDCYGTGWICKLKVAANVDKANLMNAKQYEEYISNI